MKRKIAPEFDYMELDRYILALERWFYPEQRRAYDQAILPDGKWRLCLGVLVYGAYVDRFLRFCVPSLLAPGNIEALKHPLIIVHADAASVAKIEAGLARLRRLAAIEIHVIPQDVIDQVTDAPANKYWLLGAAHNLHMQQAKYRAHSYHMLMPDHIYGAGYFAGLVRLQKRGERAIVQAAISASMEEMTPVLEAARGVLRPDELIAQALDHHHPQLRPFLMNGRDDYPMSLLLLMVGTDGVHIACPHMSIVYLSHDLLMKAPVRLFNTIDGQLPFLIPDDIEPCVPSADDGMVYVEISDAEKPVYWAGRCTLADFCVRFWMMSFCQRGFERFFDKTTVLRLPKGYTPPFSPMTHIEIEALLDCTRKAIARAYQPIFDHLPPELRGDPMQAEAA